MQEEKITLLPCEAGAPAAAGFQRAEEGAALLHQLADALGGGDIPAPDVLAPRRTLARAMAHPEQHEAAVMAWRGALAVALLMDCWAGAPKLSVREVAPGSPLADAVLACLPAGETSLRLLMLEGVSLGLLGGDMGLTPAADPTGLGEKLPDRVTWYDREREAFGDPCPFLNESDRRILLRRLALMKQMPAVAAFAESIRAQEDAQRLEATALLPIRAKAVCGFAGCDALTTRVERYLPDDANINPVLAGCGAAECPAEKPQTTYLWQGVAFARTSCTLALEATRLPGEWQQMTLLMGEIELMERCSTQWQGALAIGLAKLEASDALAKEILGDLRKAEIETAEATVLSWPWEAGSAAVRMLLTEALGPDAAVLAEGPFSDMLTVIPGCPGDALTDSVVNQACWVQFAQPTEPCAALPPLSPLAAKVLAGGVTLVADSFRMIHEHTEDDEDRTHATFALKGKRTVVFNRVYTMAETCVLAPENLPTVAVWPCVPFPEDAWRTYYVLAHKPAPVDVTVLTDGEWSAGEERVRKDVAWSVAETAQYPSYICLSQEGASIGAVPNLLPPFAMTEKGSATACVDFGASGTSVVLRIGDEVLPMGGASLTRTLLRGPMAAPLNDAVLSVPQLTGVVPSALAVLGEGSRPLLDGFICPTDTTGEDVIFDLKWLSGPKREQAWRLYLGQVMLTASLTARMRGATDIAWRVAFDDAMAPEGRAVLADCLRALAIETAERTGLPLTKKGSAVTFAPESVAVGAYFRARSEVNLKGGMTALDIGASSATMAVWLRGQARPATVCTLPLGIHMMLLDSLLAEPTLLTDALTDRASPALRQAVTQLAEQLRQARGSMKALQRARLAMEDCFHQHMGEMYGQLRGHGGKCTRLEALLLWRLAEVLFCVGLMLEQLYQNPNINDLLPGLMPVAVTGRGALLLQGMDPQRQARLWRLTMLPTSRSHPVRELLPIATPAPKMESAGGLAQLGELPAQPEPFGQGVPLGQPATPPDMLLQRFITAFRMEFPDAMEVLLPGGFKLNGGFTPALDKLCASLLMQHFPQGAGMQSQYVACLNALVQQWEKPEV